MIEETARQTGRRIVVHVKGSAQNGGRGSGGYAATIKTIQDGSITDRAVLTGIEREGSNNVRLEMLAALAAIKALPRDDTPAEIVTDNDMLVKGMTEWLEGWQARGWRTASGVPIKNPEVWQQLVAAVEERPVTWRKIVRHSGDLHDNEVDLLARKSAARANAARFGLFFTEPTDVQSRTITAEGAAR